MGCHLVHGADYNRTIAPAVELITIRILLVMSSVMDLDNGQIYVLTAIRRALYGHKQELRQGYSKINSFLIDDFGLKSSPNDP
eukprot:IDg21464t1